VFAWSLAEIPRIDPSVISHHLNVCPDVRSIKQKKIHITPERLRPLEEKVEKFLALGFIKKVHYLDWLANVVMVKKPNGK